MGNILFWERFLDHRHWQSETRLRTEKPSLLAGAGCSKEGLFTFPARQSRDQNHRTICFLLAVAAEISS